jgi:hypothetical protein
MSLEEAQNPQTTPERLTEIFLSLQRSQEIIEAIAKNPNTPTATLIKAWALYPKGFEENLAVELLFLESPQLWSTMPAETLKALLTLPSITAEVLTQLSKHWSYDIRPLIAKHHNTPPEVLHTLASTYPLSTQENVAKNRNAKVETLLLLVGSHEKSIRDFAAKNPQMPPDILRLARRIGMSFSDEAAVVDTSLKAEELEPLFACGAKVIEVLQAHPNMTEEQLVSVFQKYKRILPGALASNPRLPSPCLEELAKTRSLRVSEFLAKNPSATEPVLTECLTLKSSTVSSIIANRNDLTLPLQEALSLDKSDEVKVALAQNPKTPVEILCHFAKNPNSTLRSVVAARSEIPHEVLAQLARDKRETVRVAVAKNPSAPGQVLSLLAQDISEQVRSAAKQNPSTPIETLQELDEIKNSAEISVARLLRLAQGGFYAKQVVVDHPCTPVQLVYHYGYSPDKTERLVVARSHKTPPSLLDKLSLDPDAEVRASVASNVTASAQALEQLAKETKLEWILQAIAENPSAPPSLLESLFDTRVKGLRERLARNPASSPALLKKLFGTYQQLKDGAVLRALFSNPNLPTSLLLQLGQSQPHIILHNPRIQALVLQGAEGFRALSVSTLAALVRVPEADEKFLRWAVEHPDPQVKAEIAGHAKTPPWVLASLLHDASLSVLRRLSKNKNAPQVVLVAIAQHPDIWIRRNLISNESTPIFLLRWLAQTNENGLGVLAKKQLEKIMNK